MRYHRAMFMCVAVLLAWASVAGAQASLGFRGIGVRAGMVNAENLDATVAFGVFADLGQFHPNVAFETYMNYWSKSEGVPGISEVSFRDIAVGAKTEYMFGASPTVKPFVGAGVSVHFLQSEATIEVFDLPGMSFDTSDTKFGVDLGGGLRAGVADRIDIIGEAWYSLVSDFNQLGIQGGLLFRL